MRNKERKYIKKLFGNWNEVYIPEKNDWGEPVGEEVEPDEVTYAAMEAAEKDEDMYGPFENVKEMMEALNS